MEILKENIKEEIHVLMVEFPSQGHLNPMLRLGERLVKKGLHVTLATTEFTRHRMLKSSTINPTFSTISISGVQVRFFSDGQSLYYDRKVNYESYMKSLAKFGTINLSNHIKEHFPSTGHKKLSCIINNPFITWVADVAINHGIPRAMVWIHPCSLYAIYYCFYNKLNSFPTLTDPEMSVELPGLPLLHTEDLPSFVHPSISYGIFPKLFSDMFRYIKKYKWVLGNSFFGLKKDAIESIADLCPISPVGPLVPSSLLGEDEDHDTGVEMWKAEDTCIEWLNKEASSSVIYVSFRSVVVLSAKQMECIAKALKNRNSPFIWVVKQPDLPEPDGAGQLPLGFLKETKDQGVVVSWSQQTKVLAHPAIACFITRCGWNSMLETIAAGMPVIAYPHCTDQPINAKLIGSVFCIGLRVCLEL
ncbi:PREDICTED: UDP-glycosyltransferase 84B1-like [Populus euphratica]|uniref:UDP-glycosyltransferase 84B1-like n=1 Tax=Populus euphratica TaxID=75702 RepID=A0AAJ6T6M4_POPEU|nr:PREDICTED: UDP-glycosyltransferase 84B1-like [Populus euphratica]